MEGVERVIRGDCEESDVRRVRRRVGVGGFILVLVWRFGLVAVG